MEKITVIGLDLAKHVFQVHGNDDNGRCVVRRRLWRSQVERFFATLAPCLIGMEACSGAHEWARRFERMGHTVKLMPASYVKPYVKQSKSDSRDAEAIAEAVVRPAVPRVPVKSEEQQAELMLHRTRELLIRQRTMLANAIRGHLAELGIVMRKGIAELVQLVPQALDRLPEAMRLAVGLQLEQLLEADRRIVLLGQGDQERRAAEPGNSPARGDPGLRPAHRLGVRRDGRRPSASLPFGPRLCRLDRTYAADQRHWRQGHAGTDRQARRCLSAPAAHPRRQGDPERPTRQARQALRMGAPDRRHQAHQCRHRGAGQQDGPHRLGVTGTADSV